MNIQFLKTAGIICAAVAIDIAADYGFSKLAKKVVKTPENPDDKAKAGVIVKRSAINFGGDAAAIAATSLGATALIAKFCK